MVNDFVNPLETDRLAELIDQKLKVLAQLRQLANRQTLLISDGNISALLGLLAAKQRLLGNLQSLERQLDMFRQQDPDRRVWRSLQAREQTRQAAERCQTLLDEIMQIERSCESDLVQRRDVAADSLRGAHTAAQAQRAYTGSAVTRPRQIDLSSET